MMLESILYKDVNLVLPNGLFKGDLYVKDGKIVDIGPSLSYSAELEINESGLTLMPGVIDPHVHFREPGATQKETLYTGSKSAVSGGVTSFFEMPNTKPSTVSEETLLEKKDIAASTSLANYNFFIGANHENLDILNAVKNVPGIKIYVGSSTGSLLVDEMELLESIFSTGSRLIAVHSEEESIVKANQEKYASSTDIHDHLKIRSDEAAMVCTEKLINLALKHKRRLHICHLTTKEEALFFQKNKQSFGSLITTEVTPQHLLLQAPDCYDRLGTKAQINPPIRGKEHQDVLWQTLLDGSISCVVTDHAPHTLEEKAQPFPKAPSGMPGVDTSLRLMLNQVSEGRISLQQVVEWMCAAPARLFNVKNKGQILKGYDADLVLVDLDGKQTISQRNIYSKAGWSAFEGTPIQGIPIATYVNGQQVFREGNFFEDIKGKEVLFN